MAKKTWCFKLLFWYDWSGSNGKTTPVKKKIEMRWKAFVKLFQPFTSFFVKELLLLGPNLHTSHLNMSLSYGLAPCWHFQEKHRFQGVSFIGCQVCIVHEWQCVENENCDGHVVSTCATPNPTSYQFMPTMCETGYMTLIPHTPLHPFSPRIKCNVM